MWIRTGLTYKSCLARGVAAPALWLPVALSLLRLSWPAEALAAPLPAPRPIYSVVT